MLKYERLLVCKSVPEPINILTANLLPNPNSVVSEESLEHWSMSMACQPHIIDSDTLTHTHSHTLLDR